MMTDFPRLLVATEFSPNGKGGGGSGAVMRQMLKGWPTDKLFWWSCFPDRDKHFGQDVAAHRVAVLPRKLYPNRRWAGQKSWLLEKFWVPLAARHFRHTLERFKPDAVWVHPHCWAIPPLARLLPGDPTGFHVSIHDYMDICGISNRMGVDRSRRLAAQAELLYAGSVTRDAISAQMIADLQARTGATGTINRAGLEQDDFDFLAGEPAPSGKAIRIAYAGTIIAADEFALVARALAKIRDRLAAPLTLEFFGDHSYRSQDWFEPNWMSERGHFTAPELATALKEYDWGLSPMRLTDDDPRYNRFSLPTKFVSYLAAGLPIIVVGHPESTVSQMASHYEVGVRLTDGNPETLQTKLLAALSEPNPKARYRAEIERCALAEFDARRMRAVLHENLRRCAGLNSGST